MNKKTLGSYVSIFASGVLADTTVLDFTQGDYGYSAIWGISTLLTTGVAVYFYKSGKLNQINEPYYKSKTLEKT